MGPGRTIRSTGMSKMKVESKSRSLSNTSSANKSDLSLSRLKNPYKAKCVVYGAMMVMLRVCRLCGLAPVRLERRRGGWLASVSPALCALTFVVVTLLNAAAVIGLHSDMTVPRAQSTRAGTSTRRFLWTLDLVAVMLNACMGAYKAPGRVNEILLCTSQLQKLKAGLGITPGMKKTEEWHATAAVVTFVLASVSIVVFDYYSYFDEVLSSSKNVKAAYLYSSYFGAYIILFLMEMQFIVSAWEIKRTFKYVNDLLQEVGQLTDHQKGHMNSPITFINGMSSKTVCKAVDWLVVPGQEKYSGLKTSKTLAETIHHLQSTFEGACEVVRQLNGCFGPELLVMTVTRFLHLVMTPYNFISSIRGSSIDTRSLFSVAMWCLWHFFCTVAIVEPGHFTQQEIDRTNKLVCQLLQQSSDELVVAELDKFTKSLMLNRTIYSPMGAFTLSRSLVVTIVGSVATYLVIIIQFQAAEMSYGRS